MEYIVLLQKILAHSIRLAVADANTCRDTTIKTVRVKPSPTMPAIAALPDTIVCSNVSIVLKTVSADSKLWFKNAASLGVTTDSLVVNNATGAYSLKVTNTDN